jgi:hypothetical protein
MACVPIFNPNGAQKHCQLIGDAAAVAPSQLGMYWRAYDAQTARPRYASRGTKSHNTVVPIVSHASKRLVQLVAHVKIGVEIDEQDGCGGSSGPTTADAHGLDSLLPQCGKVRRHTAQSFVWRN